MPKARHLDCPFFAYRIFKKVLGDDKSRLYRTGSAEGWREGKLVECSRGNGRWIAQGGKGIKGQRAPLGSTRYGLHFQLPLFVGLTVGTPNRSYHWALFTVSYGTGDHVSPLIYLSHVHSYGSSTPPMLVNVKFVVVGDGE